MGQRVISPKFSEYFDNKMARVGLMYVPSHKKSWTRSYPTPPTADVMGEDVIRAHVDVPPRRDHQNCLPKGTALGPRDRSRNDTCTNRFGIGL